MKPTDLLKVTSSDLLGSWRVQSHILSRSDPSSIFAKALQHHFSDNGIYRLTDPYDLTSRWELKSQDNFIKVPLLQLKVGDESINALMTRLLNSDDSSYSQLTIYLSTGLELVLIRSRNPSVTLPPASNGLKSRELSVNKGKLHTNSNAPSR